jgi:Concanavalin A-like lectin/glucanases superfamily
VTASHFTPRLHLPYPDENDPADVPLDIGNLANALDTITARAPGSVLANAQVLEVGLPGQLRAGRQLAPTDFTTLGLGAPVGLWNLSDLTDASGFGRALSNKGAVPFGVGINGVASTAAQFAGSTAQALYIPDTGAADPFRLLTGSWGCWFRTAKRATGQCLFSKRAPSNNYGYELAIGGANNLAGWVSIDGANVNYANGIADVCDDRWHQGVMTFDGSTMRVYLDGLLESISTLTGVAFAANGPFTIGAEGADGATAGVQPCYGRIDEVFVTPDVLSGEQVRLLYCAKLPHGLAVTPTAATLGVRRAVKGGPFVPADFPSVPLRLHNFTAGALADQGSNNVPLAWINQAAPIAGADGRQGGAFHYTATLTTQAASTDAGLPAGVASRSYGCWFKQSPITTAAGALIGWGTTSGGGTNIWIQTTGIIQTTNVADTLAGPIVTDGRWHFVVVAEDNAAADGLKRKMYVDGRIVAGSTVLTAITLAGANHFRVGANPDGTAPFNGDIDGVFVLGITLTADQVRALYAKGTQQLAATPKNAGDHIEAMDATNLYVTLDTLDSQHAIDLAVTG